MQLAFEETRDGVVQAQGGKRVVQMAERMRGGLRDQGLVARTSRMKRLVVCGFACGSY